MSRAKIREAGTPEGADRADRAFFDSADLLLAVADDRLALAAVNPAWRKGLGPRASEIGRSLDDILPADLLQRFRESGGGVSFSAPRETFKIDVEGAGPRWFDAEVKRRGDWVLVALLDLTERWPRFLEAQDARESRDKLLHDAGIGTWRFDPDAEAFHFSPELMRGVEATPDGVPKAYVDSLTHPADLVAERSIRERITHEGGVGEMELRMRDAAGGWEHVRILLRSGKRLASGRYEMYGLTQAVTELATARDEARSNAERLRVALKSARGAVFDINFAAEEVWCSPEFVALAGRSPTYDEIAPGGWASMKPEIRDALQSMIGLWGSPGHESVDVRVGEDGAERWARLYCDVEREPDGTPIRGVGLLVDIDDAKRQELALVDAQRSAQDATLAKSAFLASVSHEIRTPMNGIVGVLHLLKSETISDDGRRLLNEALACSGMLSQIIDDVLDFSKIEAGKLDLAAEATDVADALKGVVDLLKPQAAAHGLYLRTRVDPGLDWVMIDPVRLRQCMFNLIGNAVKFTKTGGVEVRLSRPAPDRVRIEVEDTGIGIPEAAKSRMFDRFEQADSATTRNFNGTGLGLANSRSLAPLKAGDIGFESEENKGSTFWLDVEATAVAAPAAPQTGASVEAIMLEGVRILVVDDNATNRLVASKIIESLGAEAVACEDGPSAIAAAAAEAFDLILMDVNMPGMDGLEAVRHIRALGGAAGETPVIALTANVMAHQRQAYLEAGMNGMVGKPFSPAGLLAEISRLLADGPADQAGMRTGIAS